MTVDELEQPPKDVMSQVVGIAEEVAQPVEAITAEAKEEGLSFPEISEAVLVEAKAEEDLGQMIACVLDPGSKVEKTWDLHKAYHFVRIGAFTDITSLLTASTPLRATSYSTIL